MTIVRTAISVDGRAQAERPGLAGTYADTRAVSGFAWVDLYEPDVGEVRAVAEEFGVRPLAAEDATKPHHRSKIERYGDVLLVVLLPARYVERDERVKFGEIRILMGADFVVTLQHTPDAELGSVGGFLEARPELLRVGPGAVLYAIFEHVVSAYAPVIAGLQNDVDEIEEEVFGGKPDVSRRIYALSREVIEFQRATAPLIGMLEALQEAFERHESDELRKRLRHVHDDAHRVADRAAAFRQLLADILSVNSTLVSQRLGEETKRLTETSIAQNDQVKRISAWAAIGLAPAVISSIYGMNFLRMPELEWAWGYPFALLLMVGSGLGLYVLFKRRHWL